MARPWRLATMLGRHPAPVRTWGADACIRTRPFRRTRSRVFRPRVTARTRRGERPPRRGELEQRAWRPWAWSWKLLAERNPMASAHPGRTPTRSPLLGGPSSPGRITQQLAERRALLTRWRRPLRQRGVPLPGKRTLLSIGLGSHIR